MSSGNLEVDIVGKSLILQLEGIMIVCSDKIWDEPALCPNQENVLCHLLGLSKPRVLIADWGRHT